jgi:hypothetical protein
MELQDLRVPRRNESAVPSTVQTGGTTFRLPEKPSRKSIEAEEWKYTGYPIFSQFVSSDNDFLILRRFGRLGTRVLLALQDDITLLEQDLKSLDSDCSRRGGPPIHNGSFRADVGSLRATLLRGQIYEKLKMYRKD